MTVFAITCIFAGFCAIDLVCEADDTDHEISVKARFQQDRLIAEFWTPGTPTVLPWPAVVSDLTWPSRKWSFFSSGEIQGTWMLTVLPTVTAGQFDPTAKALISMHVSNHIVPSAVMAARGTCSVEEERV